MQSKLTWVLEDEFIGMPGTSRFSPEYPSGERLIGVEDFVPSPSLHKSEEQVL